MNDWHGNEDAGDMGMMNRAAQSECRPFTCPGCGLDLGAAADFEGEDDGTPGECDQCGEVWTWWGIDGGQS
ncbi:hypothetical protein DRQ50_00185 [bacterium]|nr:MAG: hypothetical protein DRQ50_00185 [bacterium]RKZ72444.1 MAG: hypothetical protein DRQ48_00095 [Gammaproteobacteria bacterium]